MTCNKCSNDFDVGIGGIEPEEVVLTCPNCGSIEKFSPYDIAAREKAYGEQIKVADKLPEELVRNIFKK